MTAAAAAIAVVTVVAGCGGSSSTSDWNSGSDVLDDLAEAGIACPWQGSEDQVTPLTTADGEAFVVQCEDYSIVVVDSVEDEIASAQESASCQDVSTSVAQSAQAQRLIVVGDNYLVQSTSAQWPAAPSPQDLAQPFDGEVLAALDLYGQVCPDAMVGDDPDDSGSWRKTMRRAAITGGTIALYLNRDDPEDSAAAEDEDAIVDEDTEETADDGDADDESSKNDGKTAEDTSDNGSDGDSGASHGSGNGSLSDRWDALRDWLAELVNG
ncbi:MAG: hypothetical protein EBY42_08135 [Actinobacteria bacterium]|nr:hypothetical protein [Actinomycetota bacterium]